MHLIQLERPLAQSQRAGFSPEVAEEALQVVGIAQLGLALVGALAQAAPCLVQLGALLLQVLCRLGVGLDQALGRFPKGIHLGKKAVSSREGESAASGRIAGSRLHTHVLSPCRRGPRGPSQSPRACAAGLGHWPGRGHNCLCLEPGSSLRSTLWFRQHLCRWDTRSS